ncbi:hypothetical protein [Jeotgalicoccus marinus]|uniref:hypothetical protein n=1 Tax=Jeotgalicoccus marinus TaxID=516700 RepID=UPI000400CDB5|nr:hypothetical protein [Jeotgalicoccus marinus]
MLSKEIELSSSYIEYHINDNFDYHKEIINLKDIKIIINLNNHSTFDENYDYLFTIPFNKHVELRANKHSIHRIDLEKIVKKFLIKKIEVEDYHYYINCFTSEQLSEPIIFNNRKIIGKMKLLPRSINSLSKSHELVYTANNILNKYKEVDENFKVIKQKLNYVNSLASKM